MTSKSKVKSFSLELTCENAAFQGESDDPEVSQLTALTHIASILRDAAKHVTNCCDQRSLQDANGNVVGRYRVKYTKR